MVVQINMGNADAKKSQRDMNPETIQAVIRNNCDLTRPHPITNVFYCSNLSCKTRIEHELTVRGFTVHRMEINISIRDKDEFIVEATIVHSIDSDWIDHLTDACVDLASKCCAEYDGWYTEID